MRAVNLKTEYLKDPMGIDIKNPRLFWNCEGGKKQTAYRVVATSDMGGVWDSGKVSGDTMSAVYPKALSSRERVQSQQKKTLSRRLFSEEVFGGGRKKSAPVCDGVRAV